MVLVAVGGGAGWMDGGELGGGAADGVDRRAASRTLSMSTSCCTDASNLSTGRVTFRSSPSTRTSLQGGGTTPGGMSAQMPNLPLAADSQHAVKLATAAANATPSPAEAIAEANPLTVAGWPRRRRRRPTPESALPAL